MYKRLFARLLAAGDDAQHRVYGARKRRLFAGLEGTVVEVGAGTGVNLPYLPPGIRYVAIEPNRHLHPYIERAAQDAGIATEVRDGQAEALGFPDASVDAAISTLVLCSVADQEVALAEIRRVLKPGGRLLFIEHVAAPPGTALRLLQRAIKPFWRMAADGCRPDRTTADAIRAAGFASVHVERFTAPLPVVGPHIIGTAARGERRADNFPDV